MIRCKECIKQYYENNLNGRIAKNLRSRLYVSIKNSYKIGSAVKDINCSIDELKQYLEEQFYPCLKTGEQMTWDNWTRDGWHIDHIKPLSSFDLTNREQFLQACHYTNLQPLWYYENYKKGSNFNYRKKEKQQ